ncbi:MAG: EF-hand domain-containing protein [Phycisphaerae bacterium]
MKYTSIAAAVLLAVAAVVSARQVAEDPEVWPYDQAGEKNRFLDAAGVDNEVSAEEFAASAKTGGGFARSYDRWDTLKRFDRNGNGQISWLEADAYRQKLSEQAVKTFDADGDNKLSEAEQAKLKALLAAGRLPGELGASADRRPGRGRRGRQVDPETLKKYDTDGDGQLSREERRKAWQDRRAEMQKQRLEQWDTDKDGQLSEQEQAAERDARRKAWQERIDQALVRRFDKDGDGQLNQEEQAARDQAVKEFQERREQWRQRAEQRRQEMIKKYDADGDGELSETERNKIREDFRQRARAIREQYEKQADTDGDGQVSREERRAWFRKQTEKYDTNGDGRLDREEMRKMMQSATDGQSRRPVRVIQTDENSATVIVAP